MKQSDLVLNLATKRRRKFLDEMERVVPRANLVSMIAPYAPGKRGRPPFAVEPCCAFTSCSSGSR